MFYLLQTDLVRETGNVIKAFGGLEIVELVIIAILIIAVVLIWKCLPEWISKKSEIKMLQINKQNEQVGNETNALVKETSNRLEKLETAVCKISDINKKIDDIIDDRIIQSNKLDTVYKDVLSLRVYDENSPILDRLEAFNEYIKLGGNGNCKDYAKTNLILKNKELWKNILKKEKVEIIDLKEYYKDSLLEIKKNVLI